MAVNLEIKGMLARLLATEDLIVEHKKVDTACFNVETRCLTLPIWEKATNSVYDLLVSHEVGHALETPQDEWEKVYKIPKQFVNVTEDARVEKLMKRRYPGLPKTFYNGYKELHEQDFFCLKNEDVPKMNLADRANIYFKVGNFVDIKFTDREKEIIDVIANAETFQDALNAAELLYQYCKNEEKFLEEINIPIISSHSSTQGNDEQSGREQTVKEGANFQFDENADSNDKPTSKNSSEENNNNEKQNASSKDQSLSDQNGSDDDEKTEEPEVKTVDSLQKSIDNLIDEQSKESLYFELPTLNLDTVIVQNQAIYDYINEDTQKQVQDGSTFDIFRKWDTEYNEFKISAQKEVNYLVKEFECRKAAKSYARMTTSSTGVLDCARLHTYKFNEDLFKRISTLNDGKNHGLIFILDWSGSMSDVMLDTIKQLYNLIWFCKKVSIPFDVYAFTNNWSYKPHLDSFGRPILPQKHHVIKPGMVIVDESFNLLNLFTSKVNNRVFENQLRNMWRIVNSFKSYGCGDFKYPSKLGLSGTPLNESLVALHQIVPKFVKQNNVEKVHCVILTDGEASGLPVAKYVTNYAGQKVFQHVHIDYQNSYLRDRKTGNTYKIPLNQFNYSCVLLNNLKDNFPDVSFIGLRILLSRDATYFVHRYVSPLESHKILEEWRKNKSFAIKTSGYDSYFGLSSSALSVDADFVVRDDASKSQIKNAFMKSLRSKKMNKKILKEFVELIS